MGRNPHPPRYDLVARYREQISSGTYRMPSAEALAEAMLRCETHGNTAAFDAAPYTCACGAVKSHSSKSCADCAQARREASSEIRLR